MASLWSIWAAQELGLCAGLANSGRAATQCAPLDCRASQRGAAGVAGIAGAPSTVDSVLGDLATRPQLPSD
eukprot:13560540-Alexandrium_andersonii.AAC.1